MYMVDKNYNYSYFLYCEINLKFLVSSKKFRTFTSLGMKTEIKNKNKEL